MNLGDDVLYSGTVSAAVEGTILGVPSMAVSQEGRTSFTLRAGAHYARARRSLDPSAGVAGRNARQSQYSQSCRARPITGVRVTCFSRRRFENPIIEKVDPHGRTYYWIAGTRVSWSRSKDADHEAIEEGCGLAHAHPPRQHELWGTWINCGPGRRPSEGATGGASSKIARARRGDKAHGQSHRSDHYRSLAGL